ncbi:hypothetical protein EBR66_00605 [bacterium]|nr:hypothetical protein [bacterium]
MKREYLLLAMIAALFLVLRLPGVELPLHQDEYKWPQIVNPAYVSETEIPHPPLSQFIYALAGKVTGYDVHLRFVPLTFGLINLFLLWYWMRHRFGPREALLGALFFALSFYSVLASLMVDTDGQILPFFLLIALIAYERAQEWNTRAKWWSFVLVAACVAGFFVKTSFVLVIGALMLDFLWERRTRLPLRTLAWYALYAACAVVALLLLLILAQKAFPFFNLRASLSYWEHFASLHHNWFQTAIQVVKACFYLSPFLVLMPVLVTRDIVCRTRPLFFFVGLGLFFYLILFDFSVGALDRYLQFLVIPLVVWAVLIVARIRWEGRFLRAACGAGVVVAVVLLYVQFFPHSVPSLYPKADWIGRITHFHWAMLYPFSGGSGPLTFYMSFLFIALIWCVSVAAVVLARWKTEWRVAAVSFLVPLALVYNGMFTEEYLAGAVNGFAPGLVERSVSFIAQNPDIQRVVVYNDNGGAEVQAIGKYEKRLYTSPDFNWNDKAKTMNAFSGHYLVIDAPPVDPNSFFAKYFATCQVVYSDTSRAMTAKVYDCRKAPKIQL